MTKIGYARVSTTDQELHLQVDALTAAGCTIIYEEKISAHAKRRPPSDRRELAHALKALRKGDTLVVYRLDRLGRSLPHLVSVLGELEQRGIFFQSLTEKIETETPGGRLMFHVFAALAEFERAVIRERTMAGLQAARARGRVGGRPQVLSEKDKKLIRKMRANPNITIKEIAERFGVGENTIYRHSQPPH